MSAIFILLSISLVIATGFLVAFLWAVLSGQYDDTTTPALRLLGDDPREAEKQPASGAANHFSKEHDIG